GLDQAAGDGDGLVDGNGEAETDVAARRGDDRGVDAEQPALRVDERTAGVALIDGGVGLDKVFVAARVGENAEIVATRGRDDAHGHGLADAERVAHRKHDVADPDAIAVADGDKWELARVHLDDGNVGLGVGADHFGLQFATVGQGNVDTVGSLDDVIIGEDVAVAGDDHTGSEAL